MTHAQYRDSTAWKNAIDLGPRLARLAEELPAAEQHGLAWQLRQCMVELPAAIAADLLDGSGNARRGVALRLVAVIELIERVYPALDATDARLAVDKLAERLLADDFHDAAAPPAAEVMQPSEAQAAPMPEELSPAQPAETMPDPAATPLVDTVQPNQSAPVPAPMPSFTPPPAPAPMPASNPADAMTPSAPAAMPPQPGTPAEHQPETVSINVHSDSSQQAS